MQFGTQGLDAPPPAISHILYVSGYKGGLVAIPPPIAKKGGEKKRQEERVLLNSLQNLLFPLLSRMTSKFFMPALIKRVAY